jgi:hypothetical protein
MAADSPSACRGTSGTREVFGATSVALEDAWTNDIRAVAKPIPVTEWTIIPVIEPVRSAPNARRAVR